MSVDLVKAAEEVNALLDQYETVLETNNMELLSSITAHDADMVNFGTSADERVVGWEALSQLMQAQFDATESSEVTVKDRVIKVHEEGKVAWYSEINDWVVTMNGEEMTLNGFRVTGVLEKRDGKWLIVQLHFSVPDGE